MSKCECSDPACPVCKGSCEEAATITLFRVDMRDETGIDMCEGCASDAISVGIFSTEPQGEDVGRVLGERWEAMLLKSLSLSFTAQLARQMVQHQHAQNFACAVVVGQYLVGWHSSQYDNPIYDFFCFREYFRADRLVEWQQNFLQNALHHANLGCTGNSLAATHLVSWTQEITPEIYAMMKERFVG